MSDIFSSEKRSAVMKAVKSRNTKTTELKMIEIFKELHIIGWRRTYPLIGKPDFVFPKKRIVIFVDGCFWHGHEGCRYYVLPKTNTDFWKAKIERNRERDLDRRIKLRDMGWHVIQFWECQLKPKVREENLQGLLYTLNKIMLLNYQPKPYRIGEPPMTIAAEKGIEYRKNSLSLSPETDKKA